MNIKIEIEEIKSQLDKINDEHLIETIKHILSYSSIKEYENSMKPMTREELIARANQSNNDIEKGNVEDIEDVMNESKNW